MSNLDVKFILPAKNELGEGPLWNVGEQCLYWVDIDRQCYHTFHPESGTHEIVPVGVMASALAFRAAGGLVMATQRGFARFDPVTRQMEYLGDPEQDQPTTRFNDGKVDRAGRFWAGTMGVAHANHLYRLDPDGQITRMESGIDVSNGLGWSPDNRVMYYTDSTAHCIYAYDFDLASGSIANRRVFADRGERRGMPDGLTVDNQGYVWSAVWDGWCIERFDPHGRLELTIPMPVQFPTSVAFGGPSLEDLYITSALIEIPAALRPEQPLGGGLFCVRGLAAGLPEPAFAG